MYSNYCIINNKSQKIGSNSGEFNNAPVPQGYSFPFVLSVITDANLQ